MNRNVRGETIFVVAVVLVNVVVIGGCFLLLLSY
jgi:hypothetical protein